MSCGEKFCNFFFLLGTSLIVAIDIMVYYGALKHYEEFGRYSFHLFCDFAYICLAFTTMIMATLTNKSFRELTDCDEYEPPKSDQTKITDYYDAIDGYH